MTNPADVGVASWPCYSSSRPSPRSRRGSAEVVTTIRAQRTMPAEHQLVHLTITSGVDDLSEKLQAIRDALQAWRWPRFRARRPGQASRVMTSRWWGVVWR